MRSARSGSRSDYSDIEARNKQSGSSSTRIFPGTGTVVSVEHTRDGDDLPLRGLEHPERVHVRMEYSVLSDE